MAYRPALREIKDTEGPPKTGQEDNSNPDPVTKECNDN